MSGFSELEIISMNFLEEECLGITDKFRPLQSSYTQSGTEDGYTSEVGQGAPEKDDGELSDSGDQSRNE